MTVRARSRRRDQVVERADAAAALGAVHREIALPGGAIHYVEAGTGTPVLLLHGGHGSWTHWVANIGPLARRFRVLALDMPGFGASFNPEPSYDLGQYAATIVGVLDALSIDRAAIAGFSFGALVAAATARAHRERVPRIAMVNPPGIGPSSPVSAAIQRELSALAVRKGLRAGAVASLERLQLCNRALIDDAVVDAMIANVRSTRFVSRALSSSTATDRILVEVVQPVQVFVGREDVHRQYGLEELLRIVARVAAPTQIHLVENARHWLQFDRPDVFNAAFADFLAD